MAANNKLIQEAVDFYLASLKSEINPDTDVKDLEKIVNLTKISASLSKSE